MPQFDTRIYAQLDDAGNIVTNGKLGNVEYDLVIDRTCVNYGVFELDAASSYGKYIYAIVVAGMPEDRSYWIRCFDNPIGAAAKLGELDTVRKYGMVSVTGKADKTMDAKIVNDDKVKALVAEALAKHGTILYKLRVIAQNLETTWRHVDLWRMRGELTEIAKELSGKAEVAAILLRAARILQLTSIDMAVAEKAAEVLVLVLRAIALLAV